MVAINKLRALVVDDMQVRTKLAGQGCGSVGKHDADGIVPLAGQPPHPREASSELWV